MKKIDSSGSEMGSYRYSYHSDPFESKLTTISTGDMYQS